ncbi:MAG: apolipoprotein N-acyltransferase [Ectothiorhodospiraceae bacterium]
MPWHRLSRPDWPRVALGLIGGALCPLAYAPFGWWPVAVVAPAILLLVAGRRERWVLPAYAWGVGWFTAGGFWIYHSVLVYGGGLAAAVVFCVVLALLFGLVPLAAVWLWRCLRPANDAAALMIAFPFAWVLVEWLRGWLFTGITWLQLGYSQTDSWLNGFAPLIGSLGLSVLVAVGAGGGAWAVQGRGRQRWLPVAAGVGLVLVVGLVLRQVDYTEPAEETLDVALLQGNISQDRKWDPDYRAFTMERYLDLTAQHWDKDLVIWPETAVPFFRRDAQDRYLAPLAGDAADRGTDVLLGVPTHDDASGNTYNSVMNLGERIDFYHKRHLVPFGEYVPFRDALGALLDVFGAPMGDFAPGQSGEPLAPGGSRAAISICYEIIFPRLVATALPEATYLVNVSNDAWFGRTIGPPQHLQMARMRALEFQRPLLRSTNTGVTAAVGSDGQVQTRAPMFRPLALSATIQPRSGHTPYLYWLDTPVVVLAVVGLAGFGVARWRQRPAARS